MQVTKWSSEQRGRFDSVMSAITVPGAALAGPLIGQLGNLRLLQLGLFSQLANALLLARASAGRHFYVAAPAAMLTTGAVSAQSAMTMVAGLANCNHGFHRLCCQIVLYILTLVLCQELRRVCYRGSCKELSVVCR